MKSTAWAPKDLRVHHSAVIIQLISTCEFQLFLRVLSKNLLRLVVVDCLALPETGRILLAMAIDSGNRNLTKKHPVRWH